MGSYAEALPAPDDRLVVLLTSVTTRQSSALMLQTQRIVPMTVGPSATLSWVVPMSVSRSRTTTQLVHEEQTMRPRLYVIESMTAKSGYQNDVARAKSVA